MKKLTTIFFDSDGVLVNTEKLWCKVNQEMFDLMGIPHTKDDFLNYQLVTSMGTRGFLKPFNLTEEEILEFKSKRDKLWEKAIENNQHIIPETEKILQGLVKKNKLQLCMTTSAPKKHYEFAHKNTQLLPWFDRIIGKDDCQKTKPNPEIYLKAMELMQVTPEESLIVEDSPRGVEAGKASGVRVVVICNEFSKSLDTSNADYRLDSLTELPNLVNSLL